MAASAVRKRAFHRDASRRTTWIADVPANWNGTLLLYSHGFGPLTAADAPDPQPRPRCWPAATPLPVVL